MPITVNGPGGVSINFPDGTDAETINGVMAQHFGGGQEKAVQPSSHLPRALADMNKEGSESFSQAVQGVNENLLNRDRTKEGILEGPLKTAKGVLSALSVPLSYPTGALRSLVGHPEASAIETVGEGVNKIGEAFDPAWKSQHPTHEQIFEDIKPDIDSALSWVAAKRPVPRPIPLRPPAGPLGVTLSAGQESGKLPLIQSEQAALRGASGKPAQVRAQQFADQQKQQLAQAREDITRSLDQFGAVIADTPQEAGRLVSEGVATTARQSKAGVDAAYETAKAYPGEIHAGAFEGISQKIKGDLSLRPEPVIIDDKLTPFASHAIQDIDNRVSQLKIQNRADPFGQPRQENIAGVSLAGVDQMRKRLSAFRKDAFASGNAADGRAAKAVLDAFDDHIDAAINGGLFKGDPRAIQAWNDARAAYADYRKTFTAGKNDPVGRVVERILGKANNPAAIPNDVADFMYGSSGVNPSSLNVGVANRVKSILGAQSPEWAGVKQGLFHRLVDAGEGVTDFGPGKVAQRLSKFLGSDGKELSEAIYSSPERALLWRYAELMRSLEVPQAGANWPNTAATLIQKLGGKIGAFMGAMVGHALMPGLGGEVVGVVGASALGRGGEIMAAKQVAKQMPLVTEQIRKWQKAAARAATGRSRSTLLALTAATGGLTRQLAQIGVDFPGRHVLGGDSGGDRAGSGTVAGIVSDVLPEANGKTRAVIVNIARAVGVNPRAPLTEDQQARAKRMINAYTQRTGTALIPGSQQSAN